MKRLALCVALLAILATTASADVKLPSIFTSNMVLQRDRAVPVWGWADAGEKVTVSFAGQTKSAKTDDAGKWTVQLDALKTSMSPRPPLIARWPKVIQPNSITREVAHIIDFLPTFADIGGAKYPTKFGGETILPVEGLSMRPVFAGGTRKRHKRLFWEWAGNRAVREGRWKLCWDKGVKRWELYDLIADRTETNNLVAKHSERVGRMAENWYGWADETGVRYARPRTQ